ncbi:glycosyltransferase family 4 protein [Denitromonas sp.]|uniref:glycosyltransferase family 4 protein n=1 Tax=Denitromonas sp. TaxID=2734609 RepID=UPI002AFEE38A|nr:glycosyltransferase family 4 protein [Denitromonas sp.]
MRVLIFSQYFWPESFGINALARSMQERGIAVTVLTGQPNYPDGIVFPGYAAWRTSREMLSGIEILRVPLVPRGVKSGLRLAVNYLSFLASASLVGPWMLRGAQYDAVFVYAPSPLLQALPAVFLSWWKRAPLVVWVQDLWPESLSATGFVRNKVMLGLVGSVVRYIYRHTDLILIPSQAFREPIRRLAPSKGCIAYYPNPFVEEPLGASTPSPDLSALVAEIASASSVVFAGNLGTAQSLDTILDAAERVSARGRLIRFFIVGSGSLSEWLAEEVERRGLKNVSLPGRFPSSAMMSIFASASALLVSLRDEPIFAQTIPSKVPGYLAAGKPIIASLNGEGARVVVEAKAGVACPAGDSEALADAVIHICGLDDDVRRVMGENGRRYAEKHFGLAGLTDDLIARLEALSAQRGASSR